MNFLLLVLLLSPSHNRARQPGGNCRPQNSWSDNTIDYFTRMVTRGDSGNIKLRRAFNLSAVTSTPAVSLVGGEAECTKAVHALNSIYTDTVSHAPAYVFRIGTTRFAIADGSLQLHIFDSSYTYLLSLEELSIGAQGYTCKPKDFFSEMMIRQIKSSVADSGSRRATGLPNVPSSQVTLATETKLCNRAGLALDSVAHSQHPDKPQPPQGTGSYYVLKIGTHTGISLFGSSPSRNDYAPLFLFDSKWRFLSIIGL